MKSIAINNFARGMADDRYEAAVGEFGFSKHFDILTYPRRLQPLRGMANDTASTTIGNIIVASDGLMYGIGVDTNNAGKGELWQRSGYGGSDGWGHIPTNAQVSGANVVYDFLVDFPDNGIVKHIYWAAANLLLASDPAGASLAVTNDQSLTFSTIGQGLVHPADKILYIPYRTSSAQQIATVAANAAPFGAFSATSFTGLQFLYRAYCLSYYGNYLAIPQTSMNGIGVNSSIVGLWGRDTSVTEYDEVIPWGQGSLQVLNNLGGVLVGISTKSAAFNNSFQDNDSVLIKIWDGGAEPTLIKELKVPYIAGSSPTVSHPQATINPRVNFVYQNRLYFSINLVPGDGTNPARYGLWSVGKDKLTGNWTVTQERVATNANTETGVIAAAITGDFVSMCHTAVGTLTYSINGQQSSSTYAATSVFESGVNPEMPDIDKIKNKKLYTFAVTCLPLPSGASIVGKVRVDSSGSDSDWVTAFTFNTTGGKQFEMPNTAGIYTDGYNYEFRIESVGGAIPTSYGYKYDILSSNI